MRERRDEAGVGSVLWLGLCSVAATPSAKGEL